jgi:hypothetical protein
MDDLAEHEAELRVDANRALAETWDALDQLREADAALATLTRPTWGGSVDRWHEARDHLQEVGERLDAWLAFPPDQWEMA